MKIFTINKSINKKLEGLENDDFYDFITKSQKENPEIAKDVEEIINQTKINGDEALISYSNKFDKTNFNKAKDLLVTDEEIEAADQNLSEDIKEALEEAYNRISSYHQKQLPKDLLYIDEIGVELGNYWRAIDSVGVYVPGGTASYPSSVLMCCIPAIIAGVKEISIAAPTHDGKINPAVLYAAKICKIDKIYKIGGAQAISALAFGTKTVKKVNKIVGPGNSYVALAKKALFGQVGIDMIAGPTDITIVADSDNNPKWLAADALSQMEHGKDSKAFIITDSIDFANQIVTEISNLKEGLNRKSIIEESLKKSAIFIINNLEDSVNIVNFIAPEHLEIAINDPKELLERVNNAGAVFLGDYTPESIGDYIAGPSHTLPTEGSAKFSSGLSVFDFLKRMSIISCCQESFNKLSNKTITLAESEGLDAHALSIKIRK